MVGKADFFLKSVFFCLHVCTRRRTVLTSIDVVHKQLLQQEQALRRVLHSLLLELNHGPIAEKESQLCQLHMQLFTFPFAGGVGWRGTNLSSKYGPRHDGK